jgi:hypothetical protein
MVVLVVAAALAGAVLTGAAALAGRLVPAGGAPPAGVPAGGAVPAVVVPARVAAPGQPGVRAAAELAGAGTPGPGEPVAADATIMPAVPVPAAGRMARRVSVARMAVLAALAEVAGATASADIAAEHRRTAGALAARDRARGLQQVQAVNGERDGTAAATPGATPAGDSTGSPRGRDVTATTKPRAVASGSTAGRPAPTGVTIAPGVLATGVSARTAGRHPDTGAGRAIADLALRAVAGNGPAGRLAETEGTDAGSPRKAIVADGPAPRGTAAMSPAPRAVRTRAIPAIVAATGVRTAAIAIVRRAATVTVPRAATVTVRRAATVTVRRAATMTVRTAATSGTSGRSGVRPDTVPTGRGVPERSATTSRGRVARLVSSGPRASTASAGTCQNALVAPFLMSARTSVQVPLAAPVRNGAKRAATAKTAGPGRRRSGRTARAARLARVLGGHLAAAEIVRAGPPGPDGRVVRPVSATVRVQRRRPRGRTATDSTGAALPRPRPPGRGSRTTSPRTSCPARPRQNCTGCPPT